MTPEDAAWLEYQVIMGDRLDLEKFSHSEREVFKAIFQDGFKIALHYGGTR